MGDHPGMRVDQDEVDTGLGERHRQPARAGAQVEHRLPRASCQRQPRFQVGRVRQPGIELGEARVGIARVVAHRAHRVECRLQAEVLTAVILIKASREGLRALGPQLADVEGVAEVYTVTGEWDFVAIIRVREHDELAKVVTGRLAALEGIAATNTMVAFQQFSAHDLESMFGLGLEA